MERNNFRKNDAAVRASENDAKDAFVLFDLKQFVVAANPAAEALVADSSRPIIGRHADELELPEPLRDAIREAVAKALAGESVPRKSFELAGVRADGRNFATEAEVFFFTSAVEKSAVVVHLRDVAERQRSENKLLQLSKILRTMSEANRAMVDAQDEQALYTAMCRVVVEHGGYALAWIGLVEHDEKRTVRPAAFAGAEEGYLSVARITWDERPSGRGPAGFAIRTAVPQVCNDLIANPLMEPWRDAALERGYRSILSLPLKQGGVAFGVLSIYAHEPNAFGLEETALLIELAERLSHGVVALRDHKARCELERALAQAQKMEAIGQLSSGVAHDFNNLLQVVASSLHVIKQRPDDADSRNAAIATIQHACKRATAITRDLLTFAREEVLAPESQDPCIEVARWRELIVHSVGDGVSVQIRVPPETWPIYCDPGSLEIALINLAVNARDAMPEGGVLALSARNIHANGRDFVEIELADNGCGVEAADLKRVFEPFYTTKPRGKGTGLGLSQVARFARQSGGEARIESQPGQGTIVTLRIPRCVRASPAATPSPELAASSAHPSHIHASADDSAPRRLRG